MGAIWHPFLKLLVETFCSRSQNIRVFTHAHTPSHYPPLPPAPTQPDYLHNDDRRFRGYGEESCVVELRKIARNSEPGAGGAGTVLRSGGGVGRVGGVGGVGRGR